MIDDIAALIKAKLEADSVLSVVNGGAKVRCVIAGARLVSNPTAPYIEIELLGGALDASLGVFGAELTVRGDSSELRWKIFKRIHVCLHGRRLAKPGLNILRLQQVNVADNLPDRKGGGPVLGVLFQGRAVLTETLYRAT